MPNHHRTYDEAFRSLVGSALYDMNAFISTNDKLRDPKPNWNKFKVQIKDLLNNTSVQFRDADDTEPFCQRFNELFDQILVTKKTSEDNEWIKGLRAMVQEYRAKVAELHIPEPLEEKQPIHPSPVVVDEDVPAQPDVKRPVAKLELITDINQEDRAGQQKTLNSYLEAIPQAKKELVSRFLRYILDEFKRGMGQILEYLWNHQGDKDCRVFNFQEVKYAYPVAIELFLVNNIVGEMAQSIDSFSSNSKINKKILDSRQGWNKLAGLMLSALFNKSFKTSGIRETVASAPLNDIIRQAFRNISFEGFKESPYGDPDVKFDALQYQNLQKIAEGMIRDLEFAGIPEAEREKYLVVPPYSITSDLAKINEIHAEAVKSHEQCSGAISQKNKMLPAIYEARERLKKRMELEKTIFALKKKITPQPEIGSEQFASWSIEMERINGEIIKVKKLLEEVGPPVNTDEESLNAQEMALRREIAEAESGLEQSKAMMALIRDEFCRLKKQLMVEQGDAFSTDLEIIHKIYSEASQLTEQNAEKVACQRSELDHIARNRTMLGYHKELKGQKEYLEGIVRSMPPMGTDEFEQWMRAMDAHHQEMIQTNQDLIGAGPATNIDGESLDSQEAVIKESIDQAEAQIQQNKEIMALIQRSLGELKERLAKILT